MVQLDVPWNAPEAFVNMGSAGLHELNTESILDVLGPRARHPRVAVIRVITGLDSRSVRALVPDGKVLDRGYHDVTLVDMNHVDGPEVPVAELDTLRLMWPVSVVFGMYDLQFELERQHRACKQLFRGTQSDSCMYCRCGSSCWTFLVLRYHHRRKIVLPVSFRPNLLDACSPLQGVRCLLRLLCLFLVAMFVVLARY